MPAQQLCDSEIHLKYRFRRAAFYNGLKSKVGLATVRAAALRINLNIAQHRTVASSLLLPTPHHAPISTSPTSLVTISRACGVRCSEPGVSLIISARVGADSFRTSVFGLVTESTCRPRLAVFHKRTTFLLILPVHSCVIGPTVINITATYIHTHETLEKETVVEVQVQEDLSTANTENEEDSERDRATGGGGGAVVPVTCGPFPVGAC